MCAAVVHSSRHGYSTNRLISKYSTDRLWPEWKRQMETFFYWLDFSKVTVGHEIKRVSDVFGLAEKEILIHRRLCKQYDCSCHCMCMDMDVFRRTHCRQEEANRHRLSCCARVAVVNQSLAFKGCTLSHYTSPCDSCGSEVSQTVTVSQSAS